MLINAKNHRGNYSGTRHMYSNVILIGVFTFNNFTYICVFGRLSFYSRRGMKDPGEITKTE